jgi:hypothetical protein
VLEDRTTPTMVLTNHQFTPPAGTVEGARFNGTVLMFTAQDNGAQAQMAPSNPTFTASCVAKPTRPSCSVLLLSFRLPTVAPRDLFVLVNWFADTGVIRVCAQ